VCGEEGQTICVPKYDGLCLCISKTQKHAILSLHETEEKPWKGLRDIKLPSVFIFVDKAAVLVGKNTYIVRQYE
jgi:hypothetical protein